MNTALIAIAPPPTNPIGIGSLEEWEEIEKKYQLRFPSGYKELLATYGSGRFNNSFGIVNPFHTPKNNDGFSEFVHMRTRDMAEVKRMHPKLSVELPIYPEKGGLFPWGYMDNGGTLCWLTNNSESSWEIVFLDHGYARDYYRCNLDITDFIAKWLAVA